MTNADQEKQGSAGKRAIGLALFASWIFILAALPPTTAISQTATPSDQAENTGDDYVRPVNLFQPLYSYKTAPGSGSVPGTTSVVTTDTLNLRADRKIEFAPQWTLGLRADLPVLAKNPISSDNPFGEYRYGVSDADIQVALLHEFDARWRAGFGARLYAPTGGDILGTGKWRIMPGAAVRYALPEINDNSYLEPLMRYDVSFAGDPTRKNISNLQFAPTFNLGLPDRWFITFYPSPDVRLNYGDPITGQTGRLFLPFDARIGRKLTDNLAISLEVGVPIIKDYPVYNFKAEVRINVTY